MSLKKCAIMPKKKSVKLTFFLHIVPFCPFLSFFLQVSDVVPHQKRGCCLPIRFCNSPFTVFTDKKRGIFKGCYKTVRFCSSPCNKKEKLKSTL